MLLFVEVLASLIENFWAVYIPGKLTGKRMVGWRYSCMAIIFMTVCVSIINRYILFSVLTSAVGVFVNDFNSRLLYQAEFKEAMVISVSYIGAV